jgi:hypothetical protein
MTAIRTARNRFASSNPAIKFRSPLIKPKSFVALSLVFFVPVFLVERDSPKKADKRKGSRSILKKHQEALTY